MLFFGKYVQSRSVCNRDCCSFSPNFIYFFVWKLKSSRLPHLDVLFYSAQNVVNDCWIFPVVKCVKCSLVLSFRISEGKKKKRHHIPCSICCSQTCIYFNVNGSFSEVKALQTLYTFAPSLVLTVDYMPDGLPRLLPGGCPCFSHICDFQKSFKFWFFCHTSEQLSTNSLVSFEVASAPKKKLQTFKWWSWSSSFFPPSNT